MKIHLYLYGLWFLWGEILIAIISSGRELYFHMSMYVLLLFVLFFITTGRRFFMALFRQDDKKDKVNKAESVKAEQAKAEPVKNEPAGKSITIVGTGCEITGDMTPGGNIEIYGKVKGNINAGAFKVSVMEKGVIEGDVTAEHVAVNGMMMGTCNAKNTEILQKGELNGICRTEVFSIITGGRFTGQSEPYKSHKVTPEVIVAGKEKTINQK
ncbi:polymer-forming cytoskeletal protein [Morganella sp. GD04133]|uniref:bactofilin family protein n=1 Tax=Morganella sp. GD04133 TaxID=2975435 RepID=UPI00244BDCD3|nr:polymer-forming cytoskeletal protein [Morganella sp. GD04133]MDH0353806.1 polymer-forming cytoskeletal protein [Morganella sp. GD04133]